MTEHTYVTCDGPSSNHDRIYGCHHEGSVAEAIAKYGWIERDGKHLCPDCAEEMA